MEAFEKVSAHLAHFAAEIIPCDRTGKVTGAHFKIAGKDWTLSVQWHSGAYSGIGRGSDPTAEDYWTFEAALWSDRPEDQSETKMCAHWIPLMPDRLHEWEGFRSIEPMAWATLEEIERAMVELLIARRVEPSKRAELLEIF